MVGEAVSNGGWNAVLSLLFPCPTYLVAPELTMGPRRLDLAVLNVASNAVFFVFEGKSNNFSWDNLSAEVRQCCQAIYAGGYTYGMGGRGPDCIIVEWDGTDMGYMYIDAQGQVEGRQHRTTHHIVHDQAAIVQILQAIMAAHWEGR
ncbi:hypothetical protein N658DRAFT_496373 [Parathielavia hyrcaniae]|uniref:Uncharacterized protein n=1 Tax=Parathielavia hyrcaniae TaxID=113614 RepID=A0AAN6Q0T3_9PEZI|nr:hypothetical protein N658DRAFT_496373 [Parathielavia hyrcaniae]